jgi:hypothetical protein
MPYVQYPAFQQFQAMPYQPFVQQGQLFMSIPSTQAQPLPSQPAQPGVAIAVRPKRKKKKQTQAVLQGHVPSLQPVQPVLAPTLPAQVPQTPPMVPMAAPSA